ncbi:hypothetical protein KVR01_011155 [Diaporthe batatas]|uniref:uncharacterized protein n=1 Tax=Diaporthe batatas TaxID=748121 RepID=UPI001D04D655|nr:uncharacterized protein KVR01_011155 [Diaporthe batatas]KAG8158712.1 hypothetical protein KVR01_011155 [Diaporthe batatas]
MTRSLGILLGTLSAAVMAAAGVIEPDQVTGRQSTPTCVSGSHASPSGYDMDYAAVGDPDGNRFYDIDPAFTRDHSVGSSMSLYMVHGDGPSAYGSFKCQYTCNGTPGCVSFFGRFVQVNSSSERFECLGFDTL